MSEGKLKTDLMRRANISKMEIEEIVNEVKNDFPMKLWMEDNHNLTQEQKDKIDCECSRQTLQWFHKWFGKLKEVTK